MSTVIQAVRSTAINHGLLIKITVGTYPTTTTYTIANTYSPVTEAGLTYQALGHFLNISEIQNDLRATNNQLTVTMSGIPGDDPDPITGINHTPNYLALMLNQPIKGSRIEIYRAFFNVDTKQLLNPSGSDPQIFLRFSGYVSNFVVSEGNAQFSNDSTNMITIQCANVNAILEHQVSGRRTNPTDFPLETGMNRVPAIAATSFDFGKPYTASGSITGGSAGAGGAGGSGGGYANSEYS